ncbi:Isoamylase 1 chloroplastic [Bienertia sinuspersici]
MGFDGGCVEGEGVEGVGSNGKGFEWGRAGFEWGAVVVGGAWWGRAGWAEGAGWGRVGVRWLGTEWGQGGVGWLGTINRSLAKAGPIGDRTHVSTQVMGTQGYAGLDSAASIEEFMQDFSDQTAFMRELLVLLKLIYQVKKCISKRLVHKLTAELHSGYCLWDATNVYGNAPEGNLLTTGTPLISPPLHDMISNDPVLCSVKVNTAYLIFSNFVVLALSSFFVLQHGVWAWGFELLRLADKIDEPKHGTVEGFIKLAVFITGAFGQNGMERELEEATNDFREGNRRVAIKKLGIDETHFEESERQFDAENVGIGCIKMGISQMSTCLVCEQGSEIAEHLFWHCPYAAACFQKLLGWLNIRPCKQSLNDFVIWWRKYISGYKVFRKLVIAACLALGYHIWRARNQVLWSQSLPKPDAIIVQIQKELLYRCQATVHRIAAQPGPGPKDP